MAPSSENKTMAGNELSTEQTVPKIETKDEVKEEVENTEDKVQRLGFTLDIQEGKIDEYIEHHDRSRPEIVEALRKVGIRNLSLWNFQNRLFYYCEYVGEKPFEEAMDEYAQTPGVAEWEKLMHGYQAKIPGTDPDSDVWWMPCRRVYHQN